MKRSIFSIAIAAVMAIFSYNTAEAQLPEGKFGVGATFGYDQSMPNAMLHYAADPEFDIALIFGFQQLNQEEVTDAGITVPERAVNAFETGVQFRYMLDEGDHSVDPFISFSGTYAIEDDFSGKELDNMPGSDWSRIRFALAFGAQAEVSDDFFITAQFGGNIDLIGYVPSETFDEDRPLGTEVSQVNYGLGGSRLGAILYF